MPVYTWICNKCEAETNAERRMADIDKLPDSGCEKCQATDMRRKPAYFNPLTKGFLLNGGGWERDGYQPYKKKQ